MSRQRQTEKTRKSLVGRSCAVEKITLRDSACGGRRRTAVICFRSSFWLFLLFFSLSLACTFNNGEWVPRTRMNLQGDYWLIFPLTGIMFNFRIYVSCVIKTATFLRERKRNGEIARVAAMERLYCSKSLWKACFITILHDNASSWNLSIHLHSRTT